MTLASLFAPTGARLTLQPDSPPAGLGAGLVRPGTARLTRPRTGTILKRGSDCDERLQPDLRVLHLPYDGRDMELDGERIVYLHETSVLGYFEEDRMEENAAVEQWFVPLWDNLLVKDDEVPENIGSLVRPGTAQGPRARSGKVAKVGEQVLPTHRPGTRIIYGAQDGADMAEAGKVKAEQGYRVISQLAILAYLDGEEDEDDIMGESWKEHLVPCPGQLLVQRAETPVTRGLIHVPAGIHLSTRSAEAVVVSTNWIPADLMSGERVFLAGSVSKSIPLGTREDLVLWVVRPQEITGRILEDPGKIIETSEHPHLAAEAELAQRPDRTRFEEGDTRAPR